MKRGKLADADIKAEINDLGNAVCGASTVGIEDTPAIPVQEGHRQRKNVQKGNVLCRMPRKNARTNRRWENGVRPGEPIHLSKKKQTEKRQWSGRRRLVSNFGIRAALSQD